MNGSSRIIEDLEASNGRIYIVTNQIIEDIFSMLSFFPSTLGVDLSMLVEALQISGVSKMIDDRKKFVDQNFFLIYKLMMINFSYQRTTVHFVRTNRQSNEENLP